MLMTIQRVVYVKQKIIGNQLVVKHLHIYG